MVSPQNHENKSINDSTTKKPDTNKGIARYAPISPLRLANYKFLILMYINCLIVFCAISKSSIIERNSGKELLSQLHKFF